MSYARIKKIEVDEKVYEMTLRWLGKTKTEVGMGFASCDEIDPNLRRTGRSLQSAFKKGKMRHDVFKALAKYIDIDPDYLSGKRFRDVRALDIPGPMKRALIEGMTPDKFRYGVRDARDASHRYLEDILALHGISRTQLKELGKERELELALQIEYAVVPVLCKYFEKNAEGTNLYPGVWGLSAQIEGAKDDLAIGSARRV